MARPVTIARLGVLLALVSPFLLVEAEASAEPARLVRPLPSQLLPAPADQALRLAKVIAERFARVPNMRATARNARWIEDPAAVWSIRPEAECLEELRREQVEAVFIRHPATSIPTPVVVIGTVRGVAFRDVHEGRPLILSCELAARLPRVALVARRFGVTTVEVLSSFRLEPETSFHTVGLGLDITGFQRPQGELSVLEHFVETPDFRTCEEPTPADPRAEALLEIACALANTHRFSTVITPNYRRGHRDHFHLDARPEDPRIFVR